MTNELRKTGGVGMNVRYEVYQNDDIVGEIRRHGQSAVRIIGHYGEMLASCPTFDEAKAKAEGMTFPSRREIYERVCARVEANRTLSLERQFGPRLAALGRDLLNGSVSAMGELGHLLNEMETLSKDRSHSTRKPDNSRNPAWKAEYLQGNLIKWDRSLDCEYPTFPDN